MGKPKEVGIKYARINHHTRHLPAVIRFGRGCILRHLGPTLAQNWIDDTQYNCQRWEGHVRAWTVTLLSIVYPGPAADVTVRFKAVASHGDAQRPNRDRAVARATVETDIGESWEAALEELHRRLDVLSDGLVAAFPDRAKGGWHEARRAP